MSGRHTVREIAAEESWLRVIADTLPAYVAYVDDQIRYRMVNRKYLEQFGRREEEIVGLPVAQVLGASYENVRGHLEAALAGRTERFETRMRTIDGERILLVTHQPDRDEDGHVRGVIVHGVDVTDRYRVEEQLRRSEERFRVMVERASVGINIGTGSGELSYMNPALRDLLGYSAEDVESGKVRWDQLTPVEYADKDRTALEQLAATGAAEPYEKPYRAKDGRLVPMLLGATNIPSLESLDREDIAVFFTDLTALKLAEAALLQTEKLSAVGKLASMISHEINNPLEAVTNLLFLAKHVADLPVEAAQFLEDADRELRRVAQVTSQTLRFHRQSTRPQKAAVYTLAEEVLSLYRSRLTNTSAWVTTKFDPQAIVTCYDADVRQVLSNLVGNAIDALRVGGRLAVRTRFATEWKSGRKGVVITIADDGLGIPAEARGRVFEAFFTTKGINGTGLGLWISKRIIDRHQGCLSFRSRQGSGHGSTFRLWLPLELAESAAQSWMHL